MLINRDNFIIKEFPTYHPLSSKYLDFWMEEKRRCIEGYWVSGVWMPGNLYFYINHGTILLNKDKTSKAKIKGKPFLRDLEWEFFYNWIEARGFSGFSDDEFETCHRSANPSYYNGLSEFEKESVKRYYPNIFRSNGELKKYVPAKDYLRRMHSNLSGYPLMENDAKDLMMMGARGFGKSYSVGVGVVLHEWLFEGNYKYYPPGEKAAPNISSIAVTAGDAKYSSILLDKTKFALDNLPGEQQIGGTFYPSPLSKRYRGTWKSGDQIVATYKKKIGGNWKDVGSGTVMYHRSFNDNPFACNGLRCSTMIFEEIGMFKNLEASRNASVECVKSGTNKFGSMMFLGTGGDMESGTIDASKMFHDPASYDLLDFEDIWEHTGKIGYFVPAYLGLDDYKNDNGFTNIEEAKRHLEEYRLKLKKGKSSSAALDDELQNRPLTPSEMFLMKGANWFPVAELQQRLIDIKDKTGVLEKNVTLYFDNTTMSGVNYKLDLNKELIALNNFPLTDFQKSNREGCVTIYEFPITEKSGKVPKGMYIIGHDPYAKEEDHPDSLATIYVLKTKKYPTHGHDEIVASFSGRPHLGRKIYNEILYKLSLFYGEAKIYFENAVGNTKEYFEKIKRLDLLALQPVTVFSTKASWEHRGVNVYGYPMSNPKLKIEGLNYIRDWLLEERGLSDSGRLIRNLDLIPDRALLQEMIMFNMDGNFDRVMGFMGCILGIEETFNQYIKEKTENNDKALDFLVNNKRLFRNKPNAAIIDQEIYE